jgi:hypothetical protein
LFILKKVQPLKISRSDLKQGKVASYYSTNIYIYIMSIDFKDIGP